MKPVLKLTVCTLAFLLYSSALPSQIIPSFVAGDYSETVKNTTPTNSKEHLYLALAYEKIGNMKMAKAVCTEAYAKYPDNPLIKLNLARITAESGELKNALMLYEPLYKMDSTNLNLLFAVADIYLELGYANKAILIYKKAIEMDIANAILYERLAIAYKQEEMPLLVLWSYERAWDIEKQNLRYASKVAQWNYSLKNYANTVEVADIVLKDDTANLIMIKYKGLALVHLQKYNEALPLLEFCLEQGNRSSSVLYRTAICYYATERYEKVPKLVLEYVSKEEPTADSDFMLGISLREIGDTIGAITYLSRAKDLLLPEDEKLGVFYFELANAYRMNQNFDLAIDFYQKGYATDPNKQKQCLFFEASVWANDLQNKKKGLEVYKAFLAVVPKKKSVKKEVYTVSLREVAERKVITLSEELFFEQGSTPE